MHIIVVSSRLAKPRSMTLSGWHLALAGTVMAAGVLVIASGLLYGTLRYAAELRLPFLESVLASVQARESQKSELFLRENLKLRLLNARLALLSRQFDTAQSDLRDALSVLDRYFDRSARRVQSASDLLRQVMNQARQASITTEIMEIVGGAEALRSGK